VSTEAENTLETAATVSVEGAADGGEHLKAVALRTYGGHKTRQISDEDILALLPLVRSIARRAVSYLKPPLTFEDLVSAGTVGLLKAARDFDASHQAELKTYAYIRIKGAILDELRRSYLLPPSVGKRVRQAVELSRQITEQTGSVPSDEKLAEALGVPVEEVYALLESARAQQFVSINTVNEEESPLSYILAAAETAPPDSRLERAELLEKLTEAMQCLDERRLRIIVLYYHQHLTMKQIAELLEITESRVSQLHASALFSLSTKLEQWNDDG
jgi:RNA polymerase sigma factor for flagellar operon FliA